MSAPTQAMLSRSIRDNPMLEADEEISLHRAWTEKGDSTARDRLVMTHLPMAMKMVSKLGGYGMNSDDMLGYGVDGLLCAVDRFDPSRGFRFNSCARTLIKEKMFSYVMRNESIIRGPQTSAARAMFFNLSRVKNELGFDGLLTPEEAAIVRDNLQESNPGITSLTVSAIMEFEQYRAVGMVSINPVTESGVTSLEDEIPDNTKPVLETIAEDELTDLRLKFIRKSISVLKDDRERAVFISRHIREPFLTLGELSKMYGVSGERIRQVEVSAVNKVRKATMLMMSAYEDEKHAASNPPANVVCAAG